MGSAVTETLEHLQGRLSDPTEFFEALQKDFQEHREDFDGFRSAFEGRGFGAAGDELIRYLDDHGRLEPLTEIANERPDELAAVYLRLGETGAEDGAASDGDARDALWQAAIDRFGASWAAWNGTDAEWTTYRDWFYDATNTEDPAMYALAYDNLDPLNELDPTERITRLRELGFDVSGAEVPETPADPAAKPESERVESYRALADDPAVEGISHEVLDELLADPDFGTKMAAARASVDAEIEAALAEETTDA
jgi:hypothetical protein